MADEKKKDKSQVEEAVPVESLGQQLANEKPKLAEVVTDRAEGLSARTKDNIALLDHSRATPASAKAPTTKEDRAAFDKVVRDSIAANREKTQEKGIER